MNNYKMTWKDWLVSPVDPVMAAIMIILAILQLIWVLQDVLK